MKKKGVPIVFMKIVQNMYDVARNSVQSVCEKTEDFPVKVGVYQGSERVCTVIGRDYTMGTEEGCCYGR